MAIADDRNVDRAIPHFDLAIRLDQNARNYYKRGIAYYAMGDYDRAISDFDQAIELDPSLLAARQARRRVQRMPSAERAFDGFNFEEFWDDHPYSLENYVEAAPSDELIASIEEELGGFRLPAAYVELVRKHNGGQIKRNCYPMDEPTGWAEGHIEISGLYAIGRTSLWSLCGPLGSKFHEREWGYPAIGVASTPTAGHQQIMLDYRTCGSGVSRTSCTLIRRTTTTSPSSRLTLPRSSGAWSAGTRSIPPKRSGRKRS
jgi:hypothetical protein